MSAGDVQQPHLFPLAALAGEGKIDFKVGHHDQRVAIGINHFQKGEMVAYLLPAQARELAESLINQADRVEGWEGMPGEAKRAAHVILPTIVVPVRANVGYRLPGSGKV